MTYEQAMVVNWMLDSEKFIFETRTVKVDPKLPMSHRYVGDELQIHPDFYNRIVQADLVLRMYAMAAPSPDLLN